MVFEKSVLSVIAFENISISAFLSDNDTGITSIRVFSIKPIRHEYSLSIPYDHLVFKN